MYEEEGSSYRTWIHRAIVDRPWKKGGDGDMIDYTPLYSAAYHGLIRVIKVLLNNGASRVEPTGLYSNPLQAASVKGHVEIIQVLLDAGADANTESGLFGTALAAASACGHLEVAQLFSDMVLR